MPTFKANTFHVPGQTHSTHHNPSMNIEFQLISLPCHFNTNHLINVPCHAHTKPIIHELWIIPLMHTHLSHTFNTILKSNKHNHSRSRKTIKHHIVSPNTSLRLKGLAQARDSRSGEPPSPKWGLENRNSGFLRPLA